MRALIRTTTPRRALAALAVVSLAVAACGSDDEDGTVTELDDGSGSGSGSASGSGSGSASASGSGSASAPADETTTTEAADETTTTTEPAQEAQRVVSLSPTHTEIMFAIGAGDQLVAVDTNSNYPAEVSEIPADLSAFEPNVEAIAAYEPDLVLIGGDFTGLGAQLDELGIGWWDGPAAASLDDVYSQIEQLGAATGQVSEAAELVLEMQTDVDAIVAESGDAGAGLSFYHEIDATFFSADSTTFIGQIYSLLGLRNIADADETESFGFPQLNAEFIIDANPDIIFLPVGTFYMETADGVAARPGWDAIAAVQNGNVVETDDEIAGRWGPRIVDYLAEVADAVAEVNVPAADG